MSSPSFTKVASGNITPSSFVKLTTTAVGKVTLAGAGEKIFGISQEGSRRTPYGGLDDGYAAIAGENVRIYGPGDGLCMLQLGGTVTIGDRLKSDASGFGVVTTTNLDEWGAIAHASGVSGELIPVQVTFPGQISS